MHQCTVHWIRNRQILCLCPARAGPTSRWQLIVGAVVEPTMVGGEGFVRSQQWAYDWAGAVCCITTYCYGYVWTQALKCIQISEYARTMDLKWLRRDFILCYALRASRWTNFSDNRIKYARGVSEQYFTTYEHILVNIQWGVKTHAPKGSTG